MQMRKLRGKRVGLAGIVVAVAAAGSAAAFQQLPAGQQVNNDPPAGINPNLPVNTADDPANSDVVGGSLVATKPLVPWAIFRQTESSGNKDQIFSRSFAAGAWTTRGNGTVGGRSSGSPFSGSLNFDQTEDGEAPSIDFAGTGRTVPWASWYEHTTGTNFGADNIFASRFDNTSGDPNQGKWIFAGQGRTNGGSGPDVPSLNIHTNRNAVNPVVQGGSAKAGNDPVPWVTWQEKDGGTTEPNQIFTSRAVKVTSTPTCPNDGLNPIKPSTATGSNNGFCFQQTGIDRLAPNAGAFPPTISDPSMNVDPSRDGVEPDMAFTGPSDAVPWVVWYEQNSSGVGLKGNELVFAAKATSNTTTADGGFQWTAVGRNDAGVLDTTGTTPTGSKHWGHCATSTVAEANCSLNSDTNADAEDPRIASGTMDQTKPTSPWVVWDEGSAASPGDNKVFVARLVVSGSTANFVIANNGQPIGEGDRADITFSGNTPYVTWHHDGQIVTGHFKDPDHFAKDGAPVGSSSPDTVRAPISSGCIADPFTSDGAACQAGALGTPFFLFTQPVSGIARLFADAYQPARPVTGGSAGVTSSTATIAGSVNPLGASVRVSFQFGTTTAYGHFTSTATTGPNDVPVGFVAHLSGLPAGTTIHYRAVATSDFGTLTGNDRTLRTKAAAGHTSVGSASVSGKTASVRVSCTGQAGATCQLAGVLTHKGAVIGRAAVTLTAGQSRTLRVSLNAAGRKLLKKHRRVVATLKIRQTLVNGRTITVSTQSVTFKRHH
jgi:hypothetical protein